MRGVGTKDWISLAEAEEEGVVGEGLAGMGISRPLVAVVLALLIAVAGATAEEPVVAADSVAGAVEAAAALKAEEAAEAAALRAELGQLRAKISALGQCARLESTGRA